MTIKSEVQGVVQALFGAYAGGYLVELTAEATANGTGAVAARLASVQGIILGQDLSTNKAFVDTILGNMGVPSTNAAYAAASKWATDELTAGASRADVVSAAVAFLSGIAAGTIVDTKYAAVATAFAAKVTAGVTYSETAAGAKVLSVAALQKAAGFVAPANLTDALASVDVANANLKGFFAALDLDFNGEADYTAAEIKAAGFVAAADTDLDNALIASANAQALAGSFNPASSDAVNTASMALREATLDSNLAAAQKALNDAKKVLAAFEATAAGNGATKAVNELVAATAASTASGKALVAANAALAGAEASLSTPIAGFNAFLVLNDGGTPPVPTTLEIDAAAVTVIANYDSTSKTFKLATGVTETAFPGVTAYIAAFNAQAAAAAADTAAGQVKTAKQAIVDAWVGDPDGVGALTNLAGLATDITTKTTAVTTAEKAITAFDKAVVELNKVIELDAQREDLEDAIAAADKVITDAGFNVIDVGAGPGTTQNDVFVFNDASGAISLFGAVGNDVVYIGSEYVLNTGKVATAGVDTQLEVFIQAKAGAAGTTQVIIETSAFGSNAAVQEVETIELVGVTTAQVTFANGYITLV